MSWQPTKEQLELFELEPRRSGRDRKQVEDVYDPEAFITEPKKRRKGKKRGEKGKTRREKKKKQKKQQPRARVPVPYTEDVEETESESEDFSLSEGSDAEYVASTKLKRVKKQRKRKSIAFRGKKRESVSAISGLEDDFDLMDEEDIEVAKGLIRQKELEDEGIEEQYQIERICGYLQDPDTDERRYIVKWKNYSYLHTTEETYDDVVECQYKGLKVLENYMQKVEALENSVDEDVSLHEPYLSEFQKVERIIAHRHGAEGYEYLCMFCRLDYSECTWEQEEFLREEGFQGEIDAYMEREATVMNPRSVSASIRNPDAYREIKAQPSYLVGGDLRDYQIRALDWVFNSWCNGRSVMLADEMGLGKTLQAISFMSWLVHELEIQGPFLCVVPLSTVNSWLEEFKKWAPDMYVVPYVGSQNSREICRKFDMHRKVGKKSWKPNFHVLLTTYEIVRMDVQILEEIRWNLLCVDEAHRLKNEDSATREAMMAMRTNATLFITGTPFQNNLKELWALLNFLDSDVFPSFEKFESTYGDVLHNDKAVYQLHKDLAPYVLRRVKEEVEKSLPKKRELILQTSMSPLQQRTYRMIHKRNYKELFQGAKGVAKSFLNIVMELKKCANHPYLFPGIKEQHQLSYDDEGDAIVAACSKMALLDKLLKTFKENGNRVLIFSQMVTVLDIIEEYLERRRFTFQRLDGTMTRAARQIAIESFNAEDSQDFCFLLSTRAGGLGVNLHTADRVIIYDSDWNPQNDLQAEARAHRIGQTKEVCIYRLLTSGSVEEDVFRRAKDKRVMDELVIQGMDTSGSYGHSGGRNGRRAMMEELQKDGNFTEFTKDELIEIIKFGAVELFRAAKDGKEMGEEEEKNAEQQMVTEMDLDAIIEQAEKAEEEEERLRSRSRHFLSSFQMRSVSMMVEPEKKQQGSDAHADSGDTTSGKKGKEEGDDETYWRSLLPQEEIDYLMSEELQQIENAMAPGQRRRETVNYSESALFDRARASASATVDDAVTGRRKRLRKKREKAQSIAQSMDSKSISKQVFRGMRHFGAENVKQIAEKHGLEEDVVRSCVEKFMHLCTEYKPHVPVGEEKANGVESVPSDSKTKEETDAKDVTSSATNDPDAVVVDEHEGRVDEEGAGSLKEKEKKSSGIIVDGVLVSKPKEFLKRMAEIKKLHEYCAKYPSHESIRPPPGTSIPRPWKAKGWTPEDDGLLLFGCVEHGVSKLTEFRSDDRLNSVMLKIAPSDREAGEQLIKPSQAFRRIDTLLQEISDGSSHRLKRSIGAHVKRPPATKRSKKVDQGELDGDESSLKPEEKRGKRGPSRSKRTVKAPPSPSNPSSYLSRASIAHVRKLKHLESLKGEEKVAKLKKMVFSIGDDIFAKAPDKSVRLLIWKYVSESARLNATSEQLDAAYERGRGQRATKSEGKVPSLKRRRTDSAARTRDERETKRTKPSSK
eukprot:TRINITY_DN140_c1_g2_i1.p1 TRINITY_DN140_c1_g2~~TRINITY_DN140_c1_g2_i1.p1  ORF type:complete len:1443 (+),score=449.71 TRINITY_DN140_c1_g2_i1:144-4472(+)